MTEYEVRYPTDIARDDEHEVLQEWVTITRNGEEVGILMTECQECYVMFEASEQTARDRMWRYSCCTVCNQWRITYEYWSRFSATMPNKLRRAVSQQLGAMLDMLEQSVEDEVERLKVAIDLTSRECLKVHDCKAPL